MDIALLSAPIVGILALFFAMYKKSNINKIDPWNNRMKEIAKYIADGSMAFF